MDVNRAFEGRTVSIWGLVLAVALLALSFVLMTGWVHAQSGSIAGTITYFGGAEPGTYHLNVDLFTALDQPPVAGVDLAAAGAYTVGGLVDGAYYVCASVDPGQPYPNPYTCYDPTGDGQPDQVVISGGGAVTGIDLVLGGPWLPLEGPKATGGLVTALAIHPTDTGTLYAALVPKGAHFYTGPYAAVYKSTDGALNWTQVLSPELGIYALAAAGTMVYAGAYDFYGGGPAIYVSSDSGMSWTSVFTYPRFIAWIAAAVRTGNPQLAMLGGYLVDETGHERGTVIRTDDGGLHWTPVLTPTTSGGGAVVAVLIHPITPTLWLASAYDYQTGASEIYRSEDAGLTWPYSSTLDNAAANSLAYNPAQPGTIYAGAGSQTLVSGPQSRVFRSTDAGLSWTLVFTQGGLVAVDLPATVYAVQGTALYSSAVGGDPGTWAYVTSLGDWFILGYALDLGISPAAQYAGGFQRGVFKSDDGGLTWHERNEDMEMFETPRDIDLDPQDPDRIFVGAESGYRTTDGGQSWTYVIGAIPTFAINPDDPSIVVVGVASCSAQTILRSGNGGVTFTPVYTPTFIIPDCSGGDQGIGALEYAPSASNIVYAGGGQNPGWQGNQAVVLRSVNGGLSWTTVMTLPAPSGVGALAVDPENPDVVYVGTDGCSSGSGSGCVYRTKDGGATWQETLTVPVGYVDSVAVDPQKLWVVYAATDSRLMYKSTDGGDTWTLIRTCCPPGWWVVLDPRVPSHVYTGGNGSYIGESSDGGLTWTGRDDPLCQGAPIQNMGGFAVDDSTPVQTLYAGSTGLWTYRRAAPQPGQPVTGTVMSSAPVAPVGEAVQVGGLVVDQHSNWVADGTVVTFTTSAAGIFEEGALRVTPGIEDSPIVTRTTVDGHAWATLRGVQIGTAVVTMTVDGVYGTTEVRFAPPYAVYLPLVLRQSP